MGSKKRKEKAENGNVQEVVKQLKEMGVPGEAINVGGGAYEAGSVNSNGKNGQSEGGRSGAKHRKRRKAPSLTKEEMDELKVDF
mmetsp:Transcript_20383/g.52193  ORF Transcript_20383/g.52193 Transcript_20383/m.52193 type:complete len:84 (+) Transcript_20383:152-403(+)